MAENTNTTTILAHIPAVQRGRIVSGMRWTAWISLLGAPFGYAATILLARTSPEAIGTFGLLTVYIGIVLSLFYLGGDAVAIKFVPELDGEKRLCFLASYFLVVCLSVLPWLAASAIWPQKLHYLFGERSNPSFQLCLLALSPLPILASLLGAALKGMLEIVRAQILSRLTTILSFPLYAALFVFSRSTLAHSYTVIIFGCYMAASLLAVVLGARSLWNLNGWRNHWRRLRFFLPKGFWNYTLWLQQGSALGFFAARLDMILLVNFGGLALLGKYVAVITLAEATRLIGTYFIGTLLPSLTNTLAEGNLAGASAAFRIHMRILFVVCAAATCGLILLAHPITALLGNKYDGLAPLIMVIALFIGLCTPAGVGGTLLASFGKQRRGVYVVGGQIGLYLLLFALLWPRYGLIGAVLAYGVGWVISNAVLLVVARLSSPFAFSVLREYAVFTAISVSSVLISHWKTLGLGSGLMVWAVMVSLFPLLARYSLQECKALLHCFLPVSCFSPASGDA
jgi:O-antigen/teichoic acid export membrane protein